MGFKYGKVSRDMIVFYQPYILQLEKTYLGKKLHYEKDGLKFSYLDETFLDQFHHKART